MSKCEDGCPCEFYECPENSIPNPTIPIMPDFISGVVSTNKTQLYNACYDNNWVENPNPIEFDRVFHGKITHYKYRESSQVTPDNCINSCESREIYEYAAVSDGNQCWCGNQPPYNETPYECRLPCREDFQKFCGGRNGIASFYSIKAIKGDGCTYGRQSSVDGSHEVNIVQTLVLKDYNP